MTQLASDAFAGADQSPISTPWVGSVSGYSGAVRRISNMMANVTDSTDGVGYYDGSITWPNDQYAEFTYVSGGTDGGPAVRITTGGNLIMCTSYDGVKIYIFEMVGGAFNELGSVTATYTAGDVIRLEVQGTTVRVKINGTTALTAGTPTAVTTGRPGAFIYSGTMRLDNFAAGDFNTGSNIAPTGIATANTRGSHTIATSGGQNIAPTGIASVRVVGSPIVMKEVASAGVPSAAVYGTHSILDVVLNVAPSGIASARALGTHSVQDVLLSVSPTGIASARVTGSHSVANAAAQNIAPAGVGSVAATGTQVLTQPAQSITPAGIASASAVGASIIQAGQFFIAPVSVTSPSALGSHSVLTDSLLVEPAGAGSAHVLGSHALAFVNPQAIILTGVASVRALGAHVFAVVTGPVIIEYLGETRLFVSSTVTLFSVEQP